MTSSLQQIRLINIPIHAAAVTIACRPEIKRHTRIREPAAAPRSIRHTCPPAYFQAIRPRSPQSEFRAGEIGRGAQERSYITFLATPRGPRAGDWRRRRRRRRSAPGGFDIKSAGRGGGPRGAATDLRGVNFVFEWLRCGERERAFERGRRDQRGRERRETARTRRTIERQTAQGRPVPLSKLTK